MFIKLSTSHVHIYIGLPVLPVAITVSIIYNDYGVIGK